MSQVIKDKLFNQINIAWSASLADTNLQSRKSYGFFHLDLFNLGKGSEVENHSLKL